MTLKVQMYNPRNVNSDLASNTRRIIRSNANDVKLAMDAKNLPLRHVGPRVPEGNLWISFLENELKSTGSDLVKGGP